MEVTTIVDINDICRVCLVPIIPSEVSSLFFLENHLWTKMMACAWVQVFEGDGLPSFICNKCHNNLDVAYNFKQQCESADIHLRQVLGLSTTVDGQQQVSKRDYVQNQSINDTQILRSEYATKVIPSNDIIVRETICSNVQNCSRNSNSFQKEFKTDRQIICNNAEFLNTSQNTVTCGTQYEELACNQLQESGIIQSNQLNIDTAHFITESNAEDLQKAKSSKRTSKKPKLVISKSKNIIKTKTINIKEDGQQPTESNEDSYGQYAGASSIRKKNRSKNPASEQCDICGKVFRNRSYMVQHMRSHSGNKPHQCHVCQQRFSAYSTLIIHLRIHSGDKPFICQTCGKSFTQSAGLTTHMRSHTGERPFKCEICNKSFTQSSNLLIHKQIHTGRRDHICPTCNRAFKFLKHLQSHMKLHTGIKDYTCSVCHKQFHRKSYLNTHMSIHNGNRPHKCNICGHAFSNSSNLTAHFRIHTGVKPYMCQVCKKSFAQSSALTRHIQQHSSVPREEARGSTQYLNQQSILNCS